MYTNTWKSQLKWCSSFFQPNVPLFWGFRAGFLAFLGGKRTCSWGIRTMALHECYKHFIYNQ